MPIRLQRRDVHVLYTVHTYGFLTRHQLQGLLGIPERIMRRRAKLLARDGYLNRYTPAVSDDAGGPPTPVYYPSQLSCEILSQELRDDRFLLARTSLPQKEHVAHSIAVSQTHIWLVRAIEKQTDVSLVGWINENEIVNKDEPEPAKRRTTCIQFDEHITTKNRVICKPDAAFALKYDDVTCIYFLEEDRNTTTGAAKVLKRKLPGYAKLFATKKHVTHFGEAFPDALPIFRVLFVTTTATRRDALRREMHRRMRGKSDEEADIWRFVSKKRDLRAETFLHGEIFYRSQPNADPLPLINLSKTSQPAASLTDRTPNTPSTVQVAT